MINRLLVLLFVFPLLFGCEAEPEQREFPIIRTLFPVDIDSTGASFRGELVKEGFSSTSSYGFLWDTGDPTLDGAHKVVLGGDINPDSFTIRIDSNLVKGLLYNVRAFASFNNKIVYGNSIQFLSKGSKHSPWSLEMEVVPLTAWFYYSLGFSDEKNAYVLFSNSDSYRFNPGTYEFSRSYSFPNSGASLNFANVISVDNSTYFFHYDERRLYKYQDESWTQQSVVPFAGARRYRHGFAVSDRLYILSSGNSYLYNINTDSWQSLASLPNPPLGGTDLNDRAFLITGEKDIWEYDTYANTWNLKTKFPGIIHDRIVTFSHDSRIYFGLSYYDHDQTDWLDRRFWSYDLLTDEWELLELFPVELPSADLFFFDVSGQLFIGHGSGGQYNIWKFDPSRNNSRQNKP